MLSDFKIAVRSLARSPAHTLVIVLTLALGLGTATALFASFMPSLFPTRGYAQSDRLMRIALGQKGNVWESPLSVAHYGAYRNAQSFSAVAATQSEMMNVKVDGEPRGVYGVAVSAEYFSVLGTGFAQGRGFLPEETQEGADTVAVVEWRFARGMSADGNVLGREIVNAAFARKYFPGRSPLGARVVMTDKEHCEVVGVVGDTLTTRAVPLPRIYYPLWQNGPMFPTEILVLSGGCRGRSSSRRCGGPFTRRSRASL